MNFYDALMLGKKEKRAIRLPHWQGRGIFIDNFTVMRGARDTAVWNCTRFSPLLSHMEATNWELSPYLDFEGNVIKPYNYEDEEDKVK
jgi:hypothetical protein